VAAVVASVGGVLVVIGRLPSSLSGSASLTSLARSRRDVHPRRPALTACRFKVMKHVLREQLTGHPAG
jgi:hypothetical protein